MYLEAVGACLGLSIPWGCNQSCTGAPSWQQARCWSDSEARGVPLSLSSRRPWPCCLYFVRCGKFSWLLISVGSETLGSNNLRSKILKNNWSVLSKHPLLFAEQKDATAMCPGLGSVRYLLDHSVGRCAQVLRKCCVILYRDSSRHGLGCPSGRHKGYRIYIGLYTHYLKFLLCGGTQC